MEEHAHDPRDDLYADDSAPAGVGTMPEGLSVDDLNESDRAAAPIPDYSKGANDGPSPLDLLNEEGEKPPSAEPEPEPTPPTPEPAPPPPPLASLPEPQWGSSTIRSPRPPITGAARKHVDGLMALAAFYDEHPDAYQPGGEHLSPVALFERIVQLGGQWQFGITKGDIHVTRIDLPEDGSPVLICTQTAMTRWALTSVGVTPRW